MMAAIITICDSKCDKCPYCYIFYDWYGIPHYSCGLKVEWEN